LSGIVCKEVQARNILFRICYFLTWYTRNKLKRYRKIQSIDIARSHITRTDNEYRFADIGIGRVRCLPCIQHEFTLARG